MSIKNMYPYQVIRCSDKDAAFLSRADLPANPKQFDAALAKTITHINDARDPLRPIALVSLSEEEGIDLDYKIVHPAIATHNTADACLSVLAGAGTFALETGLITKNDSESEISVKIISTGHKCDLLFALKDGRPDYDEEEAAVAGQGPAAKIFCLISELSGSMCGGIIPSGHMQDEFDGIQATCIDNGVPVVCLRAGDFGLSGQETIQQLNQNQDLCWQLEQIRIKAGLAMGLADVRDKPVPEVCLVNSGPEEASLRVHSFIRSVWQPSTNHLTALSAATAALYKKSVIHHLTALPDGLAKQIRIFNETGLIDVLLELSPERPGIDIVRAGFIQTTKLV